MAQAGGVVQNHNINNNNNRVPSTNHEDQSLERAILMKILRTLEKDTRLQIGRVDIMKGAQKGDNNMSDVEKANVEYIKANELYRKCFLLKRQLEDSLKKKEFMADQVWANEEKMYNVVLPRLRRHCTYDLPHPALYYTDNNIMIMEDLNASGFFMVDRFLGLDLDHILVAMESLSRFHAASLAMQRLDPEMFQIMKDNFKHPYTDGADSINQYVSVAILKATDILKSVSKKYSKAIEVLKKIANNQEEYVQQLSSVPDNGTAVLIHGDLWITNILFSYNKETMRPLDAKLIDFQATRMGSLVNDILLLVYSSTQSSVRNAHLDDIFKAYSDNLTLHLRNFLSTGDHEEYIEKFNHENLLKEIYKFRLTGLLSGIFYLPVLTGERELLFDHKIHSFKFTEQLTDVVDEYMRKGWLNF